MITQALCVHRHLAKNPQAEWSSIPDLPKAAWQVLDRDFVRFTSTVEQCQTSSDGTKKLLIRLQDGLKVEAVIMVYCQTGEGNGVFPHVGSHLGDNGLQGLLL